MPPFGPVKRKALIRYLQKAGFEGPESRSKHQIMSRGDVTVLIPNPHVGDISKELLSRLLRQAGISREEWEKL